MRKKLEKRFIYLFTGELTALILFIFVSFLFNRINPDWKLYSLNSFWASFFLLEFILIQGTIYWYKKWRALKDGNSTVISEQVVKGLRLTKKINIGLIFLSPVIFVVDYFSWNPSLPSIGLSLSGFIYIFAILEYINYFHIQLSYDNSTDIQYLLENKKLKRSWLSKDLRK